MHAPEPVSALYVPCVHSCISPCALPPFGPVYPAVATQAVFAVLACGEVEPTGQLVQGILPLDGLYVPAAQARGTSPLFP